MLSLLLCFSACQKLELGDEENKGGNEGGGGTEKPPKDDDDENANCDTLSINKRIAIYGAITTYFNVNGIKNIWDYNFLHDSSPETPPDTITNDWPGIDNNPQIIPGGR